MGEIALQRRVKRLEFIAGFLSPLPLPIGPGPGTEIASAISFSFVTPSPLVLGVAPASSKFNVAVLLVETPFNDPSATIQFGTSGTPGLLLSAGDSKPNVVGQYESDALVVIPVGDLLILTLTPGASTQGAGILLYKVIPP
jgi:hypothetical protein